MPVLRIPYSVHTTTSDLRAPDILNSPAQYASIFRNPNLNLHVSLRCFCKLTLQTVNSISVPRGDVESSRHTYSVYVYIEAQIGSGNNHITRSRRAK